jgi:hypothetical protein
VAATKRRDTADFGTERLLAATSAPMGSRPTRAASRELRHHPGQGLAPEQLGRRCQLVGRELHLGALVGAAQPRPADGHLAAAEGHQPVVGPSRTAVRSGS